jgi:hypothetical protein
VIKSRNFNFLRQLNLSEVESLLHLALFIQRLGNGPGLGIALTCLEIGGSIRAHAPLRKTSTAPMSASLALGAAQNCIALCETKTAVGSLMRKGHRIYLPS